MGESFGELPKKGIFDVPLVSFFQESIELARYSSVTGSVTAKVVNKNRPPDA